jgi:hypothetical protein
MLSELHVEAGVTDQLYATIIRLALFTTGDRLLDGPSTVRAFSLVFSNCSKQLQVVIVDFVHLEPRQQSLEIIRCALI